jgi:hypothetical protein
VLNEVSLTHTVTRSVRKEALHDRKLVVARENLLLRFLLGVLVNLGDYLSVVLDDISEFLFCQNLLPKIILLQLTLNVR